MALNMKGIKKSFNGVPVLKGIDFSVAEGEIHALLGENGAGKSTLMNILGGVIQPDEGTINLFGEDVIMTNPSVSQQAGVGFVHQELNIVGDLTVYENLYLGNEKRNKWGFLDRSYMIRRAEEMLNELQVPLDPQQLVGNLDTSFKQIVEISKALLNKNRMIIMDEPTASLTDKEIQSLFKVMRKLKKQGYSIIFISHKLKEVLSVCDRYTVLRDGELAGTGNIAEISEEGIAKLMVGRDMSEQVGYQPRTAGETILTVSSLSLPLLFEDVSFSVGKGEVIGFTGLSGDGRTELFETLFGYRKPRSGTITFKGKTLALSHPIHALREGIGYIPRNRKENSIVKDLSVLHNFSLTSIRHFVQKGFISSRKEKASYEAYRQQLNIKASHPDESITALSGGNQQKVVVAKWVEAGSDLLIFDNPTQGVDIGAKNDIYQLMQEMASSGKTIIVLSNEFQELYRLCDRVYVMYHGRLKAELTRDELTEEQIMMYATGAKE